MKKYLHGTLCVPVVAGIICPSCCWCLCCFRRSVAGISSFDLSILLAIANTTALLVLLWVFLLYNTERLQQQGLKKLRGRKNDDDYVNVLPPS
jgi:hypothetical protein